MVAADTYPSKEMEQGGSGGYQPTGLFSVRYHRAISAGSTKKKLTAATMAQATVRVMQRELGANAIERWKVMLDDELEQAIYVKLDWPKCAAGGKGSSVRRSAVKIQQERGARDASEGGALCGAWIPRKPKLTLLFLEAFGRGDDVLAADGKAVVLAAATNIGSVSGPLSKLMSRRVADWLLLNRLDEIKSTGEIPADQLGSEIRLHRTVCRAGADALAYVHGVSTALRGEGDAEAVLLMQKTYERLEGGDDTRGSGVVFCTKGRVLFERAAATSLARLGTPAVAAEQAPEP